MNPPISDDESSSYEVQYDLLISDCSDDSSNSSDSSESMDDHEFIDHVIEKYGYDKSNSDDSDYEAENLFEKLFEDLKEGKNVECDPHDVMKSVPIAYLYSYYDTIYETMRAAFGEDIDNSNCVQLFDEEVIDHNEIMMEYSNLEENAYLVGTAHPASEEDYTTYCIGLSIQNDDGENIHNECSCGNYGEMKYIKEEIYISF